MRAGPPTTAPTKRLSSPPSPRPGEPRPLPGEPPCALAPPLTPAAVCSGALMLELGVLVAELGRNPAQLPRCRGVVDRLDGPPAPPPTPRAAGAAASSMLAVQLGGTAAGLPIAPSVLLLSSPSPDSRPTPPPWSSPAPSPTAPPAFRAFPPPARPGGGWGTPGPTAALARLLASHADHSESAPLAGGGKGAGARELPPEDKSSQHSGRAAAFQGVTRGRVELGG